MTLTARPRHRPNVVPRIFAAIGTASGDARLGTHVPNEPRSFFVFRETERFVTPRTPRSSPARASHPRRLDGRRRAGTRACRADRPHGFGDGGETHVRAGRDHPRVHPVGALLRRPRRRVRGGVDCSTLRRHVSPGRPDSRFRRTYFRGWARDHPPRPGRVLRAGGVEAVGHPREHAAGCPAVARDHRGESAARAAGIKRHLTVDEAAKLCPGVVFVHVETIGDDEDEEDDEHVAEDHGRDANR